MPLGHKRRAFSKVSAAAPFDSLRVLKLLLAALLRLADLHSSPPGLHYDEAADMLLGRDIAFYGYQPFPVVEAYSGREALFYYLAVPMLHIFGTDVFATRLTSALLGILTVAVTFALGRAMFKGHPYAALIALCGGAWLAVNGAQVWLTRQGFRTSPQPLLEALALWCLFIALRRERGWARSAALGGFFGGAALYTYMAARIFPLWLLLPLGALLLIDTRRALRLRQSALFLAVLAITALPITLFYLSKPEVFLDRLAQVTESDVSALTLLESLRLHAEMFFLRGDPLLRYNLAPERPWFDPISGVLMLIGFGAALRLYLRRAEPTILRIAALCVLLAPLLILPSVVAVGGLPPSHMRSVAMVPLIFFAPALGIAALVARVPRLRYGIAGLVLLLALHTWSDYRAWASRADLFYDAHGDMQLIGQWLEANLAPDEVAYIVSAFYNHPTVLAHRLDHSRIRWLMAEHLIIPPEGEQALYLFPRTVSSPHESTFASDARVARLQALDGPDGAPAFTVYRLQGGTERRSAPSRSFGGFLSAGDALTSFEGRGGQMIQVSFAWDVLQKPDRTDLTPVVALRDPLGEEIARFHPYFEQSDRLRASERLIIALDVPLPLGALSGTYTLHTAWLSRSSGALLPLVDAQNRFSGLWAEAARIAVGPSAPREAPPQGLALSPYLYAALSAPPQPTEQGDWLRFTVTWQALQAPGAQPDLILSAHPPDGTPIRLWQGQPVRDSYPFAQWRTDEYLVERYAIRLPPELPAGDYTLRLSLADRTVFEAPLRVIGVVRRYDRPDLPPCDARFCEQIALIGCQIVRDGAAVHIRLAWQALSTPEADFTLTVQALNADGSLFSQQDGPPAIRPTTRWLAGEVFESTHTLATPPDGTLRLIAALYTAEDGRRLPVRVAGETIGDAAPLTGE
ncbi:MAG: glycosyltransferase family 39 protein [Aggregatilineales bacterium]